MILVWKYLLYNKKGFISIIFCSRSDEKLYFWLKLSWMKIENPFTFKIKSLLSWLQASLLKRNFSCFKGSQLLIFQKREKAWTLRRGDFFRQKKDFYASKKKSEKSLALKAQNPIVQIVNIKSRWRDEARLHISATCFDNKTLIALKIRCSFLPERERYDAPPKKSIKSFCSGKIFSFLRENPKEKVRLLSFYSYPWWTTKKSFLPQNP